MSVPTGSGSAIGAPTADFRMQNNVPRWQSTGPCPPKPTFLDLCSGLARPRETPVLETFVAGLAQPWGPGYVAERADLHQTWLSPHVASSVLGSLKNRYLSWETVIDLDCRQFRDPDLVNEYGIHLGFHHEILTRVVDAEQGAVFHGLMADFWTQFERLSHKAKQTASGNWSVPQVAVICWCETGRYRSGAVGLALHWCLRQDC